MTRMSFFPPSPSSSAQYTRSFTLISIWNIVEHRSNAACIYTYIKEISRSLSLWQWTNSDQGLSISVLLFCWLLNNERSNLEFDFSFLFLSSTLTFLLILIEKAKLVLSLSTDWSSIRDDFIDIFLMYDVIFWFNHQPQGLKLYLIINDVFSLFSISNYEKANKRREIHDSRSQTNSLIHQLQTEITIGWGDCCWMRVGVLHMNLCR